MTQEIVLHVHSCLVVCFWLIHNIVLSSGGMLVMSRENLAFQVYFSVFLGKPNVSINLIMDLVSKFTTSFQNVVSEIWQIVGGMRQHG